MMKSLALTAVATAAFGLCVGAASAQTLRWASQGDAQTMDPHSQNEGLTNSINQQVYEYLIARDKQLNFVPGLATSWEQVSALKWRFKLRQGVKFHDGSAFNADDVVYSVNRAKEPTSQIAVYANAVGVPKKIDDFTVEFDLASVNPVFMDHLVSVFILDKEWSEKNKATKPQDFKNKEEHYAAMNANGTGPFILVKREPGIKTTWKRNPSYWRAIESNVQDVVFTPIGNDATRSAALISGELDFILDPPPRDVAKLRNTAGVKVIDGPENRIVFIGMDQSRDELQYSNVKGKNPFKDVRVRKALYHAVDIETMKNKLMSGQSYPTGGYTPSPKAGFNDPKIEGRLPFDLNEAKRLMTEAGYPNGFEVQLDCPNNRYIQDEEICVALAAMWEKIGVKIKVVAQPRVTYFPKLDKFDTSLYMLGWGGAITDAETTLTPVMRNLQPTGGVGSYNYGRSSNAKFDDLAARSSVEADPVKRKELILAALTEWKEQVHTIPLHRQVIPWAARSNVTAVHRPDNYLVWEWVTIGR
jgi:peptide/nickel transport system substrate-binding protein